MCVNQDALRVDHGVVAIFWDAKMAACQTDNFKIEFLSSFKSFDVKWRRFFSEEGQNGKLNNTGFVYRLNYTTSG